MTIRKLMEIDRTILAAMISRDVDHLAQGWKPEFFFNCELAYCFENDCDPVFYVRFIMDSDPGTVRVFIQFDTDRPLETARMLTRGWEVVRVLCMNAHAKRIVFDSIDGRLRDFCQKRFGFVPISGTADLEFLFPVPSSS